MPITLTFENESALALDFQVVTGQGWDYDEAGMTYDEATFDGRTVYYDGLGTGTSLSMENESALALSFESV